MKKVFAILAVAGVMAACNSGENKEKMAADSARIADSTAAANAADSAAKAAADTSKAMMDTTKH
jgi:transglutaminase/protease-like cytokinesis protein 3